MRRWRALYASAEVEEAVDSCLVYCLGMKEEHVRGMAARIGMARIAFREAIIERREALEGF
jgi:hypothetical protein